MLRKYILNYLFPLFLCALLFLNPRLQAQVLDNSTMLNLNYLRYGNEIPEELLTGRTVVFVDDEALTKEGKTTAWKSFARKAHGTFRMLGIDPVAYYNLDLVLSGASVTNSFSEDIKNRLIKHAIVLKREISTSNDTLFSLILTTISDQAVFFEPGQPAFQLQQNNLNNLLQQFIRAVSGAGLEKSNFLILEYPEFFSETNLFTSGRFESYNPDLKLDKLAVSLFEEKAVPKNIPPGMSREEVVQNINAENLRIKQANDRLKELMQTYPFNSGPVSFKDGEAVWKKDGNHFVLLSVYGKAAAVRELLKYETVEDQPTFTTTKIVDGEAITEEIDKNQKVYKYYIKHINSGEIYLGTHWDADTSWDQALENFILNLKASFEDRG